MSFFPSGRYEQQEAHLGVEAVSSMSWVETTCSAICQLDPVSGWASLGQRYIRAVSAVRPTGKSLVLERRGEGMMLVQVCFRGGEGNCVVSAKRKFVSIAGSSVEVGRGRNIHQTLALRTIRT